MFTTLQVGRLTQWQKHELGVLQALVSSIAETRASGVSTQGEGSSRVLCGNKAPLCLQMLDKDPMWLRYVHVLCTEIFA